MVFNVNDTILYGTEGVCRVAGIVEKEIAGEKKEYYMLKPAEMPNSTIYVPLDSKKMIEKAHRILSKEEIYALIESMPGESIMSISEDTQRKVVYQDILNSGDRVQLIRLIRTLYVKAEEKKKDGKKVHVIDERCMKEAEKILYEEFAYVLDIELDQVLPLILEAMNGAKK